MKNETVPASPLDIPVKRGAPQGVVAIVIGPDKRVIASASSFESAAPAGFSKREAQEMRASRAVAKATMDALAVPLLTAAISTFEAEGILRKMCNNGCRMEIVAIGYEND